MEFLTLSEMLNNPQIAAEAQRYLNERWQRDALIPSLRSQGEYTFYAWPVYVWRRKLAERVVVRVWQCEACAGYFGIKVPKPGHVVYWNRNCPGCREPLSDAIQTMYLFTMRRRII